MSRQAINFRQKFALFAEPWQPRVVAESLFTTSA